MSRVRLGLASSLTLVYVLFVSWYTPLRGPLSAAEVEHYVGLLQARSSEAEEVERLRAFLAADTGRSFAMVNAIEMRQTPLLVAGVREGESPGSVLSRYMEFMWPALLRRACHPVLMGSAAAPALDAWGVEGARTWSQGAVMRYRSRRDLMEIATDPRFSGPHEFKVAAMAKTIAFPIDPWFHFGDPRLILGLCWLIALMLVRPWKRVGRGQ